MAYEYGIYIAALILSLLVTTCVGSYLLFKSRKAKGAPYFLMMLFLVILWTGGTLFETVGASLSVKIFWVQVQYITFCYLPVVLLALSVSVTGHANWISRRRLAVFSLMPSILMGLVWTNQHHGLIRNNEYLVMAHAFPVIHKTYGPGFYLLVFYAYTLMLTALLIFIHAGVTGKGITRKQLGFVLAGVGILVLSNILYTFGMSPIEAYDITPALIGPCGLIISIGIFYHRLFDLMPIARNRVVETMGAAMVVMDMDHRIVDMNPAAQSMFKLSSIAKNQPAEAVFSDQLPLLTASLDNQIGSREFSINTGTEDRYYEAFFSMLYEKAPVPIGKLMVIHDVTDKRKIAAVHLEQQRRLAVAEEKERMARDLHDNLGQVLGFINMQAQGIQRELTQMGVENVHGRLQQLADTTRLAHGEIRAYIRSVRGTADHRQHFLKAIENETARLQQATAIACHLETPAAHFFQQMAASMQLQLLNMIREALNNIRKHAAAANVNLRLEASVEEQQLTIIIEDDGIGFDPTEAKRRVAAKESFGLTILEERAREIGANLVIRSATGQGTTVRINVPAQKEWFNATSSLTG
ncbi:PAS domain-containing protein [Anoxynatronum buryatiense]|uniref:histidine kinase n=2 Tax=Anoxynatronum buryatiense TaxID=489973 RepID=A0AA46AJS6_9CLOT|nr:PAS domain-containing protein [Anoxynatronum buryatiense]